MSQETDHDQCLRCGRRIKSKKAKELGYGPVCWMKTQAEQAVEEVSQVGQVAVPPDAK